MYEFAGQAIVLSREPYEEHDSLVSLYFPTQGKVKVRAISARKITAKLASHLEPGMLSYVRVIAKNYFYVVDVLKIKRTGISPGEASILDELIPEYSPDNQLWDYLTAGRLRWRKVLAHLGWDSSLSACVVCGRKPSYFLWDRQLFVCDKCVRASLNTASGVILL